MHALLSRTAKLVPGNSSILLVPVRATKITFPPLPSVWGQLVVFAPMRFRLKCGPLGAPLPVSGVLRVADGMASGVAARSSRTMPVMVVASRVFSFMFLQTTGKAIREFSDCEVISQKRETRTYDI